MTLYAVVQPMVRTLDGYKAAYGEDDPEELRLMQIKDRALADTIIEVLRDLFDLEYDELSEPSEGEGIQFDLGPVHWIHQLRELAAAVEGKTVDEFHDGRAGVGVRMNHLINHDEGGLYVPAKFPQAFFVDTVAVGSAPMLLTELEALTAALAERWPPAMARARTLAENGADLPEEPPRGLRGPVWTWLTLTVLCRAAVARRQAVHLG